jgi:hypothetical protein
LLADNKLQHFLVAILSKHAVLASPCQNPARRNVVIFMTRSQINKDMLGFRTRSTQLNHF